MKIGNKTIAVADCETDPFVHGEFPEPFIWGYYDGELYREFSSTLDFLAFVFDQSVIVYAHNGGRFDWHFLIGFIPPETAVKVINGRLVSFKIGRAEFRDSYSILPVALSKYKKDEFDYNLMNRDNRHIPENMAKIREYLHSDCLNLFDFVTRFIANYGLHLTQASAAMAIWSDMTGRAPPHDIDGVIYREFSSYYYGGRCECRRVGEHFGAFEGADINSAYPDAMLRRHPIGLEYHAVEPGAWWGLDDNTRGAAFLVVVGPARGVFPSRVKGQTLEFPDDGGERQFFVTGWEVLAAVETGLFDGYRIDSVICFDELTDFSLYVNYFYNLRKIAREKGDKAEDIFCKLFLNSLYGKFSSNPERYEKFRVVDSGFELEGESEYSFCSEFGDNYLVSRFLGPDEQRYYNVATSASITGYVRAKLFRAIHASTGFLYCDTDSIFAESLGGLEYGTGLGTWEHLGRYDYAAFGGRKLYCLRGVDGDYKVRSKGARLTAADLIAIARGDVVTYYADAPTFSAKSAPRFITRKIKRKTD
ncbi:MAG: DNA polymerase [Pyrinomonadaceae bacterium]